jgi:hypothetical protein
MARPNQPSKLKPTEPTFDDWLTLVESLQDVTASEEELAFLAGQAQSDGYSGIARQANQLATSLSESASDDCDWKTTSGEILVLLLCGYVALQRGLASFLPVRFSSTAHRDRLAIYLGMLTHRVVDPWPVVKLVVWLDVLGPRAAREFVARCEKHVGSLYAAFPHMKEHEQERLLMLLCKKSAGARRRDVSLPSEIRRALKVNSPKPREAALLSEVKSAVGEILSGRISQDPIGSIAMALDGQLNKNPKFVVHKVNRGRKKPRYRTLGVDIERKPGSRQQQYLSLEVEDQPDEEQRSPLDLLIGESDESEDLQEAIRKAAGQLCEQRGKHRVAYGVATKAETTAEAAKKNRKTPKTIAAWKQTFFNQLRELVLAQNPALRRKYNHLK